MPDIIILFKLVLIAVFAVSGFSKLADPAGTREALREFRVPTLLHPFLEWALPGTELLVAVALLLPAFAWWGAVAALLLLLLFSAVVAGTLAKGRRPKCHCFGQVYTAPIGAETVIRNGVLLLMAGVVAGPERDLAGIGIPQWVAQQLAAPSAGALVAVAALTVAAVQAWLLHRSSEQTRRLQVRLEAVEARLQGGGSGEWAAAPGTTAAGLPQGTEAPDFTLPDLQGMPHSLDDFLEHDRPVLLFFVSPDCAPCKELLPEFSEWQATLRDRLTLVWIATGDPSRDRPRFQPYQGLPLLLERQREVAERFKTESTPSALLIRADGTIGSEVVVGVRAIRALVARVDLEIEEKFKPLLKTVRTKLLAGEAGLPPGVEAPPFEARDLHGQPHALSDFEGRPLLLIFFSPECSFCLRMMPRLAALSCTEGPGAPQLLVVASGGVDANRSWVEEHHACCPVLLEEGERVSDRYRASGTPTGYLIDARGRIASELALGEDALFALLPATAADMGANRDRPVVAPDGPVKALVDAE